MGSIIDQRGHAEQSKVVNVILFYKYAALSSDEQVLSIYKDAHYKLTSGLDLCGRILLGLSNDAEGINGTLSGNKANVLAFVVAMLGYERYAEKRCSEEEMEAMTPARTTFVTAFWEQADQFARAASLEKPPCMDSPEDFKWSTVTIRNYDNERLFPDLNIKIVSEIISTGGVLSAIKVEDTSHGYLTPEQFHREVQSLEESSSTEFQNTSMNNTILIDCRNQKVSRL